MAQKVQIVLEDDIDGGKGEETVSFSLDGRNYEIDLSAKNAAKLRDAIGYYIGHSRKAGGTRTRTTKTASRGRSSAAKASNDPAAVRAWARSKKIAVSERGRISAAVLDQYNAAH